MKKYFTLLLLAIFGFTVVMSCDDRNDNYVGDGDTYSVMKDINGSFNAANDYTIAQNITINSSDVVLVYRNVGSTTAVWQAIPKTYYLDATGRELDYNFDFTTGDVQIYTQANFDQATMSSAEANTYLNNQQFRIVLVPASQGKNAKVDYSDYNAVVKYFNIKE